MPYLTANIVCLGGCLLLLWFRRHPIAGTTLVAPFRWTLASLLSLLGAELAVYFTAEPDTSTCQAIRYLAATTTICPAVAVLGAKRPQNLGWQFIVASLWVILALPAAEAVVLWRGGQVELGLHREWFWLMLLLVELGNYLPTRNGASASMVAVGRVALLHQHLPLPLPSSLQSVSAGYWLISCGIVLACFRRVRPGGDWDDIWIRFRDAFGVVWALRVMQRVNETARSCRWNAQLRWYGFDGDQQMPASPTQEAQIGRTMKTVLRRFVSPSWFGS